MAWSNRRAPVTRRAAAATGQTADASKQSVRDTNDTLRYCVLTCINVLTCVASLVHHTEQTEKFKKKTN